MQSNTSGVELLLLLVSLKSNVEFSTFSHIFVKIDSKTKSQNCSQQVFKKVTIIIQFIILEFLTEII